MLFSTSGAAFANWPLEQRRPRRGGRGPHSRDDRRLAGRTRRGGRRPATHDCLEGTGATSSDGRPSLPQQVVGGGPAPATTCTADQPPIPATTWHYSRRHAAPFQSAIPHRGTRRWTGATTGCCNGSRISMRALPTDDDAMEAAPLPLHAPCRFTPGCYPWELQYPIEPAVRLRSSGRTHVQLPAPAVTDPPCACRQPETPPLGRRSAMDRRVRSG